MSLYDYLGRPAGSDLGNQVFRAASVSRIPVKTKEVTTPAYKGKIMMYPENCGVSAGHWMRPSCWRFARRGARPVRVRWR